MNITIAYQEKCFKLAKYRELVLRRGELADVISALTRMNSTRECLHLQAMLAESYHASLRMQEQLRQAEKDL